jgi:Protein of unknown function (DUF3800)
MAAHIYLDESGDMGWQFDKPYTQGGSSRFLVIAACILPPDKDHKPERLLRHLYQHRHWNTGMEKKWARMSLEARTAFAKDAAKLIATNLDISLHAIAVDKRNVQPHIRMDSNKLYNYMVKLLLIDLMAKHDYVNFVPDPRSIKVESGNSLHDYLQTELWLEKNAKTKLETTPRDSRHCLNLQFADMVAGVIQSHIEFGNNGHWQHLQGHVQLTTLFC